MPIQSIAGAIRLRAASNSATILLSGSLTTKEPLPIDLLLGEFMTTILEGICKQGRIDLVQPPPGLPEGRVRIILIADDRPQPLPRLLIFGKYPLDDSTLEDFRCAQWHGEPEFDPSNGQ